MEDLRQHFSRTLDQTGIALTGRQLLAYAKDRGLRGVGPREISAIVSEHPSTAKFAAVKRLKKLSDHRRCTFRRLLHRSRRFQARVVLAQ